MARSELGSVTAVTGGRAAAVEAEDMRRARAIQRRRGLPGGRAALGALLMTVAAIGVFLAYAGADDGPADKLVVTTRPVHAGEMLAADDVRVVDGELSSAPGASVFRSTEEVVGRVTLGPIAEGEIVQAGSVTTGSSSSRGHEVAITVPREQLAVGRLRDGERVDVFVTYEDRTSSVVRGAAVVEIARSSDGSLTSDREVSIVVSVPSGDVVAALVHALRTGDVTVVRSTFGDPDDAAPVTFEAARE